MINKIRTLLDIQVKLEERKLENGTVVEADSFEKGKEIFIKTDDEKVAMPVGEYILEDGQLIVVEEEGIIADVRDVSDDVPAKEDDSAETEDMEEDDPSRYVTVDDWKGMEERIANLEDAIADLKGDKQPRSEKEVEAESSNRVKSRTVKEEFESSEEKIEEKLAEVENKEELSEPAVDPIKHSPEGNFKKENKFQFAKNRTKSVLDVVLERINNYQFKQ